MSSIFPEYGRKTANEHRQTFEVKAIHPPKCKWVTIDDFDLSKIPIMFVPAEFQRKTSSAHVYRIVESIINNTFYDNTIRCVKLPNGKYLVIDGQHRLQALWVLHKQYGIKHYNIVMQYFKNNESREVFRKINSGRKLTTIDFLKTMDDGTYSFFDEIRDYATHKLSKNIIGYLKLLNALNYQRTGLPGSVPSHALEDLLSTINPDDMAHMYRIAQASAQSYKKLKSDRVFAKSLTLPLFTIGHLHNYSHDDYVQHLEKIVTSDKISEILKEPLGVMHKKMFAAVNEFTISEALP